MQGMQKMSIWNAVGVLCVAASVAAASEAELDDVCRRLESALELQVVSLEKIIDAQSAAAALPQIREALDAQKALFGVDENELWNYIDRTEHIKVALMRMLQRIAAETDRISKADFFGNDELRTLLF